MEIPAHRLGVFDRQAWGMFGTLSHKPRILPCVIGIGITDRQKETNSEVECSICFQMLCGDIYIDGESITHH